MERWRRRIGLVLKLRGFLEDFDIVIGMRKVNDGMVSGKHQTMTSVVGRERDRRSRVFVNVGKDTIGPRFKILFILIYLVMKIIESYHHIASKIMLIFKSPSQMLIRGGNCIIHCSFLVALPSHFKERVNLFSN